MCVHCDQIKAILFIVKSKSIIKETYDQKN